MTRTHGLVLVGLFGFGCGDAKNEDDTGSNGADPSGEGFGCDVVEETPLELDGTTPTGASVQDAANILDGAHTATLTWNDDSTTGLTVTITEVSNPRFEDHEVVSSGSGPTPAIEIECNDQLVFDIQISIVTEDGQLNETMAHTATQIDGATSPTLLVDLATTTGTFNPTDWTEETFDEVSASLTAEWTETGIQGLIDGMGTTTDGQIAMASRIDIATFAAEGL